MKEKWRKLQKMNANILLNYRPIIIPGTTRFWMVRTKKGYFYDEFINNNYVALGWNEIDIDNYCGDAKLLKDHIYNVYKEERPGLALNKCKNFIGEIKEGDILVIPSEGSRRVTFAKAGEYYEEKGFSTKQELEVTYKINNKEISINSIECPYKKRRKIEILSTVTGAKLNYHLMSAISSYHGICNLDEYGHYILDCIYDIYEFRNDICISINVTKKEAIKPREISNLLYGLTEYLCAFVDEDCMETTINLNSPGKVRMHLKKIADKLNSHCWCYLAILVVITGGSVKDAELPGVVKVIQDFKTINIAIQQEEATLEATRLSNELAELEIQSKKIENAAVILEILKSAEENNVDINKLLEQCDILLDVNGTLKLKSNENLIDNKGQVNKE